MKRLTRSHNSRITLWVVALLALCCVSGALYGFFQTYRNDFPQGIAQDKTAGGYICPNSSKLYAGNGNAQDSCVLNEIPVEYPIAGQLGSNIVSYSLSATVLLPIYSIFPIFIVLMITSEKSYKLSEKRKNILENVAAIAVVTVVILGTAGVIGGYYYVKGHFSGGVSSKCYIKGNINSEGQKIYHLPQDKYYIDTEINTAAGERWFCSVQQARDAGWRASEAF